MIPVDIELSLSHLNYLEKLLLDLKTGASQNPQPHFLHLCGIPGSGKSTYAANWMKLHPHYYLVQFDSIMENLPGYKSLAKHSPQQAFHEFELPARAVGYKLLQALLEARRSILFDHSACNRSHPALIKTLLERGFTVEMHYLPCSTQLACSRVSQRANIRHTLHSLVHERAELLEELLPIYRSLTNVVEIAESNWQKNAEISLCT